MGIEDLLLSKPQDPNLEAGGSFRNLYALEEFTPNSLKILYLVADDFGCGFYRGLLPATMVNMKHSEAVNVVVTNLLSSDDLEQHDDTPKWDVIVS